jgi:hypothetical protein
MADRPPLTHINIDTVEEPELHLWLLIKDGFLPEGTKWPGKDATPLERDSFEAIFVDAVNRARAWREKNDPKADQDGAME